MTSPSRVCDQPSGSSPPIPHPPQRLAHLARQPLVLGHLRLEGLDQLGHAFLEGHLVLLLLGRAHVAAGGQREALGLDRGRLRGNAEAGDVGVVGGADLAAPGGVDADKALDLLVAELDLGAADLLTEGAGVDEQGLAAAVALTGTRLAAVEEPEADGDAGRVEELAGQGDDAVDEVVTDERLADRSLAGLRRGQRPVGSTKPARPSGARCEAKCWIQA